ncbi:MAG: hypothetical protein LC772_00435 [Chloroflexi bacterium]|nr:hypothetical protein [Chloroflexota bacterium]
MKAISPGFSGAHSDGMAYLVSLVGKNYLHRYPEEDAEGRDILRGPCADGSMALGVCKVLRPANEACSFKVEPLADDSPEVLAFLKSRGYKPLPGSRCMFLEKASSTVDYIHPGDAPTSDPLACLDVHELHLVKCAIGMRIEQERQNPAPPSKYCGLTRLERLESAYSKLFPTAWV